MKVGWLTERKQDRLKEAIGIIYREQPWYLRPALIAAEADDGPATNSARLL